MPIEADVFKSNVPFLLGLDWLDKLQLYLDTTRNVLIRSPGNISMPVVRKFGYVYREWQREDTLLFSGSELIKLRRGFRHPTDTKLLNLIRKARPHEATETTTRVLKKISKSCNTCQRLGSQPTRFMTTLPTIQEVKFGEKISMDLMFIEGKAILHIVDIATRFSSAIFLDSQGNNYGQSVNEVWLAFLEAWCTLYTGFPNRIRTDAGSVFTSPRWKEIAESVGIELQISSVEAHNSLGIGERLHAPLRRIYRKIVFDFAQIDRNIGLKLSIKAMNDTNGDNGLVPSLVVFGIIPRFPIISSDIPTQKERMLAFSRAQMEMNAVVAERRILAALTRSIPAATDFVLEIGQEVLVYQERSKEWIGPATITGIREKIVDVKSNDGQWHRTMNMQQVKPYVQESPQPTNMLSRDEFLTTMMEPFESVSDS